MGGGVCWLVGALSQAVSHKGFYKGWRGAQRGNALKETTKNNNKNAVV